ncbi:hypothetical protein QJQ45_007091 [Haematococcus lacustris]|nr:hypothetical protein QJQ45_007091 [Haematococcus lacustris]
MQRIEESRWRPLGLGYWPEQGKLPAKGKEYPSLGYKRHLAAASSVVTFLKAKLKHITVNLATLDAVWEVCLDPKWARQRLMLYGAQNRALEQFFKKARPVASLSPDDPILIDQEPAPSSIRRGHKCAIHITAVILRVIDTLSLDVGKLVAFCFVGASTFMGAHNGVMGAHNGGKSARKKSMSESMSQLEKDMAEVPMERHNRAKQLVVFFGSAGIGTGGG